MRHILRFSLCALFLAAPAAAQSPIIDQMPDPLVKRALVLALRQLHHAQCGEAGKCAPATEAEFENPPIPFPQARRIIASGVASAAAQWCELDWRNKIVLPMLSHFREDLKWSERQLALAALLHGIYQGQAAAPMLATEPCTPEQRANVERNLPQWR
jgi:hypothetical protein